MSAEGPVVIKPALRAKAGEVALLAFAAAWCPLALVLSWPYWAVGAVAASALAFVASKRGGVAVLVPFAISAVGKYFGYPYLPPLGSLVALAELAYVVVYVRSTKYVFKDDGLVISVEFPLYSKTRSIPKNTIAEVTVESSLAGKVLGYASVVVKLRTGETVEIHGVPKKKAQELTKKLITE